MSSLPTQIGWSNEDTTNAFDAIDAPWYEFGISQEGPMYAVRNRNEFVQWDNPSTQTISLDYGRQRPLITLGYLLTNAIPIYLAMGKNSTSAGVHTCTLVSPTEILPEYQFRMQESAGIVNTINHQYNCKTHTLKLIVDRLTAMKGLQFTMGTDRWLSDNAYWQDGVTAGTGYTSLMTNPTLYTGTTSLGFYLDPLSEITINAVDVADHVVRAECVVSELPTYVYQNDTSFQEEVFPSSIFESNPLVAVGCDIDMIMGIENTLIKDIMNQSALTVSAKFYSDAAKEYYTEWNFSTSSYINESFMSIPNPSDPTTRIQRIRFMCDHTSEIKTKDGISTLPTFQ